MMRAEGYPGGLRHSAGQKYTAFMYTYWHTKGHPFIRSSLEAIKFAKSPPIKLEESSHPKYTNSA